MASASRRTVHGRAAQTRPGLAAVTSPLVNSYKRLIRQAPRSSATWADITYGGSSRTQMIRIGLGTSNVRGRAAIRAGLRGDAGRRPGRDQERWTGSATTQSLRDSRDRTPAPGHRFLPSPCARPSIWRRTRWSGGWALVRRLLYEISGRNGGDAPARQPVGTDKYCRSIDALVETMKTLNASHYYQQFDDLPSTCPERVRGWKSDHRSVVSTPRWW